MPLVVDDSDTGDGLIIACKHTVLGLGGGREGIIVTSFTIRLKASAAGCESLM